MILVSDAHVCGGLGNTETFFEMLNKFESNDEDLVFLGDIFDLWIGLPRYETDYQRKFAAWCEQQKVRRRIGFVEGNHEFYVVRQHHGSFSWSTTCGHREGQTLFVHGDLINRADKNYLRFRTLTKNPLVRTLFRYLPYGPRLAHKIKKDLKNTNHAFRISLPEAALCDYAEQMFANGIDRVMVGHFHQAWRYEGTAGQYLQILPDWYSTGEVCRYDGEQAEILPWKAL